MKVTHISPSGIDGGLYSTGGGLRHCQSREREYLKEYVLGGKK